MRFVFRIRAVGALYCVFLPTVFRKISSDFEEKQGRRAPAMGRAKERLK
jgi:hypothetical protein